jgi:hypothetical protein
MINSAFAVLQSRKALPVFAGGALFFQEFDHSTLSGLRRVIFIT